MGWIHCLLGRAARPAHGAVDVQGLLARARASLESGDAPSAWACVRVLLVADVTPDALLLASVALGRMGEAVAARMFARAAQSPHDAAAFLELGSHLTTIEVPDVAVAALSRAIELAPFDAVVRSELGLAQARLGRPAAVLETLALHPCLADDPGALLLFAWSAMLTGDLEASDGALGELVERHGESALTRRMSRALERATIRPASTPPDARDFYFIEHGGLVLELASSDAGRFGDRAVDGAVLASWAALARTALGALGISAPRVMAATEPALALARDIAGGSEVTVVEAGDARVPHGVVVALDASHLEPLASRIHAPRHETITFAGSLSWDRGSACAPDLVGALVRAPRFSAVVPSPILLELDTTALRAFIDARRAHLLPRAERDPVAYVPDAPLPWP